MSELRGGLLVEGTRTNLALRSEEFDNAAWAKTNITSVAANSSIAPDGTLTADVITASVAPGGFLLQVLASQTHTAGQAITLSIFVTNALRAVSFGGATPAGTDTFSTVEYGGGWYRQILTRVFSGTGTGTFQLLVANSGQPIGVGPAAYWGAQLERGPFASSYIPTVAATVTRATDQVSYANFPQPAEIAARGGMTIYHRFVDQGTSLIAGTGARYWQVAPIATANDRHLTVRGAAGSPNTAIVLLGNGSTNVFVGVGGLPSLNSLSETITNLEYQLNSGTPEFKAKLSVFSNGVLVGTAGTTASVNGTDLIANGWQTSPTLFVGARDGGNAPGFALHQQLKAAYGVQTIDYMRGLV